MSTLMPRVFAARTNVLKDFGQLEEIKRLVGVYVFNRTSASLDHLENRFPPGTAAVRFLCEDLVNHLVLLQSKINVDTVLSNSIDNITLMTKRVIREIEVSPHKTSEIAHMVRAVRDAQKQLSAKKPS